MGQHRERVGVSLAPRTGGLGLIRPIYEILGEVVDARMRLEGLKAEIVAQMQEGHRPTHRGHPWDREMFDAVEGASVAIEAAFHYLKGIQFPETMTARAESAQLALSSVTTRETSIQMRRSTSR